MKKNVIITALCVALFAGAWVAGVRAADEEVVKAVKSLADQVEGGKDIAKDATAAAKKANDLYLWMELLSKRKPAGKGGLGLGEKPGVIIPDGIEAKLIGMRRVKQDEIDKYKAELKRMAAYTAVVGEISKNFSTDQLGGKKDPKKWTQFSGEMATHSKELWKALDKGDLAATKKAVKALNDSCTQCHTEFRDN